MDNEKIYNEKLHNVPEVAKALQDCEDAVELIHALEAAVLYLSKNPRVTGELLTKLCYAYGDSQQADLAYSAAVDNARIKIAEGDNE